jgi:hypothetical protein
MGVDWRGRLNGFILLVPVVCMLMLHVWTRIILGCALVSKLIDEYYTVVETYDSSNGAARAAPMSAMSPYRPCGDRVVAMVLGSMCLAAAHLGESWLSGSFFLTVTVRFVRCV